MNLSVLALTRKNKVIEPDGEALEVAEMLSLGDRGADLGPQPLESPLNPHSV